MYFKMSMVFGGILDTLLEPIKALGDAILDGILSGLKYFFGMIAYLICAAVLKLVNMFYAFFKIFTGISPVSYDGKSDYLINVFFSNSSITKVYWGFAIIGFVLVFVFAMVVVIRKMFDIYEKQKMSYGQLLTSCGKSILIIILMTFIVNASLSVTNVLMQRINYLFDRADAKTVEGRRYFTGEEIAVMNSIMEKIGNYAINPSYNSRYSINSCFNEIRPEMLYLQNLGVFEYQYDEDTWQGALKTIAKSADLENDLMMDVYHESVTTALLSTMDTLSAKKEFRPAQYAVGTGLGSTEDVPVDVIIFLSGTSQAAKNGYYNKTVSVNDALRGPYYTGQRSIYSFNQVKEDFDISVGGIDYIIILILSVLIIWQLITCILTCAVRIFNMLLLYVIAPPFAATIPLDDGQRFRSWVDAFVVQCLSVFGTVIIMRLTMLYIPIIMSDKLILFESKFMNLIGKTILIYAGFVAAGRGSDLFNGVLTGNGAGASLQSGNMQQQGAVAAKALGGLAADVTGVTKAKDKIQKGYKSMVSKGGIIGTGVVAMQRHSMNKKAQSYVNSKAQMEEDNRAQEALEAMEKEDGSGISGTMAGNLTAGSANKTAANAGKKPAPKKAGNASVSINMSKDASAGGDTAKNNNANAGGTGGDLNTQILQEISKQMGQMNKQMQEANAGDPESAFYDGYEVEEVAQTGLGSALGIRNSMLASTNKRPKKKAPQKKAIKKKEVRSNVNYESKTTTKTVEPITNMSADRKNEEDDEEDFK